MEKKKTSLKYLSRKPVFLFRNDLMKIEKILKLDLKSDKIKISFDDYEANSIEDIPEDTKDTKKINITSYSPSIDIDIGADCVDIRTFNENLEIEGCVRKIENILNSSLRINVYYSFMIIKWVSWGLSIYLLFTTIESGLSEIYRLIYIIILALALALHFTLQIYPVSSIITFSNKNESNFWERNSEKILAGTIIAIISSVITYLLGIIIK